MNGRTMTREQAAIALGLSVREVARKQAIGQLRIAKRGPKGIVLYNSDDIERMRLNKNEAIANGATAMAPMAAFSTEDADAVFAELEKGASALECVSRCKVHPAKVRAILREYEELTGTLVIGAAVMAKINALPLDGVFPITKGEDLLALLTKPVPCSICHKRPQRMCAGCAIPYVRKKLEREAARTAAGSDQNLRGDD